LFAISVIPGLLAALSVLLLVREAPRVAREAATALHPMRTLLATPGAFRRLLVGLGLFGAGLFSTTLLILRATDLLHRHGRSLDQAAAIAVLLYALHNAANALAAYPAGTLADRLGRRQVLVGGMTVFAISCVLFAITPASIAVLAALFGLVGISRALVETGQGSYAAELLPDDIRGRGFGLIGLVDGLGDLIANVVVGVLFSVATPATAFLFAAIMSSAGAVTLLRSPSSSTK